MNKNNYCSYQTATHYCGKQGGHTGEHYLYLKLIAGHRANCINFRDEAMCDCGALEPQTEQAYHARGAGRPSGEAIDGEVGAITAEILFPLETLARAFALSGNAFEADATRQTLVQMRARIERIATEEIKRRHDLIADDGEPGADTGTTPLDLRSAGGVETTRLMSKEECERIWPAAERGTTPPEGLVTLAECPPGMFIFEGTFGFKSEYVEHESIPDASLEAFCADSGEYFWGGTNTRKERDALMVQPVEGIRAATQRAPVEQGQPDMGEVSDGYHTFKELYEHRHALFSVICATFGGWKSKEHSDGTMFEDSFIAGVATQLGPATYHMPLRWWDRFHCQPSIRAPKWDGHTAQQVPERIASLTAPDHAREGALREALGALAKKWWKEGDEHNVITASGAIHFGCAYELENALRVGRDTAALTRESSQGANIPSSVGGRANTEGVLKWLRVHIAAMESGDDSAELYTRGYLVAKNEALMTVGRALADGKEGGE